MIVSQAISKVILSGEHAVVYGYPGVALPVFNSKSEVSISKGKVKGVKINASQLSQSFLIENYKDKVNQYNPLEITVLNFLKKYDLNFKDILIEIKSNIPIASGMGSGASISTAIIRALGLYFKTLLTDEDIYNQVFEIEKIYHGNPSGIDPKVIVYQSPFYFIKNIQMEKIDIKSKFEIVIIDSGLRSTTKEVVDWVGVQNKLYPDKYKKIFEDIAHISNNLKHSLENSNDLKHIGNLLNNNHQLLQEMGVSNDTLDQIVLKCLECGALGAKMSGAGKGGIVIALIDPEKKNDFTQLLKDNGMKTII